MVRTFIKRGRGSKAIYKFYKKQTNWNGRASLREVVADLTDVTLADQATNSIHADNANMVIHGNVAMKVTQSVGQLWNQYKRRHPLNKF